MHTSDVALCSRIKKHTQNRAAGLLSVKERMPVALV
jgi:hypothetical protein